MHMWKGNGDIAVLFYLKGFEILYEERRGEVDTIVTEHFNDILFQKSEPANKQHTNQSKLKYQSQPLTFRQSLQII